MKIPINEFEQHVELSILKRGMDYFRSRQVVYCEEKEQGVFQAIVEGVEDYIVNLRIEDEIIVSNSCSCPYDQSSYCKHQVAVMFHLQKEEPSNISEPPVRKRETTIKELSKLLANVTLDEVKEFVLDTAASDVCFRNIAFANFAHKNIEESKELYKMQIRAITKAHAGRNGFIDYISAHRFGQSLFGLIDKSNAFLSLHKLKSMFFVCAALMEELIPALEFADDANSDISGPIQAAYNLLAELPEQVGFSEVIRSELFLFCLNNFRYNSFVGWKWHIGILGLGASVFKGEEEASWLLAAINKANLAEDEKKHSYAIQEQICQKLNTVRDKV